MYPGTASCKDIPVKKTNVLHFKEIDGVGNSPDIALLVPAANVFETGSEYCIVLATPGLHRDDFRIEIAGSIITISALKEGEPDNAMKDLCEYNFTSWTRAFCLPSDTISLLARAEYKNGELVIRIPRGQKVEAPENVTIYVY